MIKPSRNPVLELSSSLIQLEKSRMNSGDEISWLKSNPVKSMPDASSVEALSHAELRADTSG